ncbi:transmembrane protein [Tieghemostelium lacteum]|uniref:Peroxisomal membrane protein PEX14 n=1 Tax=Tieghemostelium lacteum TaxID=361077 RepID=A0A152A962_TIELA|nr:transmembrane protein [Tieghemostelium lacteum]|eukprot:KYR02763.1 transmembrane protein [Tieghemostelium lacteum]
MDNEIESNINSDTNTNTVELKDNQIDDTLNQDDEIKQRIKKRKEEAKKIIEERKKREQQQQQQQQQKTKPLKSSTGSDEDDEDDDDEQQNSSNSNEQYNQQSISKPISNTINKKPILPPKPNVREDMVRRAVAFLSNPNVKNTALGKKVAYLEKKGLTTEEIKEALKTIENQNSNSSNSGTSTLTPTSIQGGGGGVVARGRRNQPNNNNNQAITPSSSNIYSNNNNQQQQLQQNNFNIQQQYLQQQQFLQQQVQSYQKRVEEGDQRLAQLINASNRFSWGNVLMSVTALVGVVSGLSFLTSQYILPYFRKKEPDQTEKKIQDLQEQIVQLQATIATQSTDFQNALKNLTAIIEKQESNNQINQNNSTELSEIKKDLKTLSTLINNPNPNNSNYNRSWSSENEENGYSHSSNASYGSKNNRSNPNSNIKPNRPTPPPILSQNPHSNLTWVPPSNQPTVIPSWQKQPTISSLGSNTNTTIPISSPQGTPTKSIVSNGTTNTSQTQNLVSEEKRSQSPLPLETSMSPKRLDFVDEFPSDNNKQTTTTTTTTSTSPSTPTPTSSAEETPYSTDFLSVINQLKQGKTPPGIRTDINDKPLENGVVNSSSTKRPPKPWEKDELTPLTSKLSSDEIKQLNSSTDDQPSIEPTQD